MKRGLALMAVVVVTLAGCSVSPGSPAASAAAGAGPSGSAGAGASGVGTKSNAGCSGGLTGSEPGVVRVSCDGPADIRIQVAGVSKDIRGGTCRSAGDLWSVAAGVIIDVTGAHGAYTGPAVDSVAINNTSTAGKGTIQVALGAKHYFDLGEAAMTLSADKKTAHLDGTSDRLSDGPGEKITVDITC